MPEKIGNGGNGLEDYNPNDGKYVEDGVPNKSYDNPIEEKKILNAMGLDKSDFIDNKELYLKHSIATSQPEYYIQNIEKIINNVKTSSFKNILLNYMKQKNAKVGFSNGEIGSFDTDRNCVNLGYYVNEDEKNYWVFFHEEGHSIDWNYGEGFFLSDRFVGSDGKNLLQSMVEDGNNNINKIINEYENYEKEIIKKHFQENNLGEFKTYEQLKHEFEINKREKPTEIAYEMQKISKQAKDLIKGKSDIEIEQIMASQIGIDLQKKFDDLNNERNRIIKEEFPTKEDFYEQNQEYTKNLLEARRKASFPYRQISDAVDSLFGKPLNVYQHGSDYWKNDKNLKNEEFFANAFQALIQNDFSLELMDKFFPKSMKVVREILQAIENEQKGVEYYG